MAAFGPRPPLPRLGDEIDRRVVQGAERVHVGRAVNHDLLPFERRIEVRDDPDLPAGRTVTEPQCLRRRQGLVAGAERAGGGIVGGAVERSWPLRPSRGNRHPATGHRVVAEVGQRRRLGQASGRSARAVNARSISIGIGNAIVVDGVAPSSSSVCR